MDLRPPIAIRSTEELLRMASDAGTWQPEARALARMELERRGTPAAVVEERERAFKEAAQARAALLERHATESYPWHALAGILLIAPLLVLGKVVGSTFFLDVKLGLTELDRRNYRRKYRQRMAMLIAGVLGWSLLIAALQGRM